MADEENVEQSRQTTSEEESKAEEFELTEEERRERTDEGNDLKEKGNSKFKSGGDCSIDTDHHSIISMITVKGLLPHMAITSQCTWSLNLLLFDILSNHLHTRTTATGCVSVCTLPNILVCVFTVARPKWLHSATHLLKTNSPIINSVAKSPCQYNSLTVHPWLHGASWDNSS